MSEEETVHELEESEDEYQSVYANNSRLEPSVWDLKVLFGQLELHTSEAHVDWHTAVTMPWIQAKIFSYYLLLNLLLQEQMNGPITVPASVMPPKPEPPSGEAEKDPSMRAVYEAMTKIHLQIFG